MTIKDVDTEIGSDVAAGTASNRVARSLREAIARGRFQAGERLYQDEIAKDLGLSRQPVRQALNRLLAEGLLTEVRPGRLVVTKMTPKEVTDNLSIRLVLEPLAARLAAQNINESQIEQLRLFNRRVREDLPNKVSWNYEFHKLLAVASGSTMLASFIDRLWLGMPHSPISEALLGDTAQKSAHSHDEMIDCLMRRDSDRIEFLMREHISLTLAFHLRRNSRAVDQN